MTSPLHLPSLSIEGFRGIRSLELPELGRVTLLAGGNGVGKTSVLDALRLYAARGDFGVFTDLLNSRDEIISGLDEDGDPVASPDISALFHDVDGEPEPHPIRIRSKPSKYDLSVRLVAPDSDDEIPDIPLGHEEPKVLNLSIGQSNRIVRTGPLVYDNLRGRAYPIRRALRRRSGPPSDPWPSPILNESLGPGLLNNIELARLWDAVVLTKYEDIAVEALRLVVDEQIERLAVVGDGAGRYGSRWPRALVKLQSSSTPVPLKRLGDGTNRLLAIALALANCRDGILLIDEVENGIHYSVQTDLWRMVFRVAEAENVQVIAATHSWDCIASFANAAIESTAVGTLFRLERFETGLEAVQYSEENLQVAAHQKIEVR